MSEASAKEGNLACLIKVSFYFKFIFFKLNLFIYLFFREISFVLSWQQRTCTTVIPEHLWIIRENLGGSALFHKRQ